MCSVLASRINDTDKIPTMIAGLPMNCESSYPPIPPPPPPTPTSTPPPPRPLSPNIVLRDASAACHVDLQGHPPSWSRCGLSRDLSIVTHASSSNRLKTLIVVPRWINRLTDGVVVKGSGSSTSFLRIMQTTIGQSPSRCVTSRPFRQVRDS